MLMVSQMRAYSWTTKESYVEHGYKQLENELGVEFLHLSDLDWTILDFTNSNGDELSIEVVKDFNKMADVTISLPVIKTHAMTGISLGIKNLWGCVPNPMRMIYHQYISDYLHRIIEYYKLTGVIYDGTISLTGNGPMFGTPKFTDIIGYSVEPIKGDFLTTKLMGRDPLKIDHIQK